jgi:hypothetical protein
MIYPFRTANNSRQNFPLGNDAGALRGQGPRSGGRPRLAACGVKPWGAITRQGWAAGGGCPLADNIFMAVVS